MKYNLQLSDLDGYNKMDVFEFYDSIKNSPDRLIQVIKSIDNKLYIIDTIRHLNNTISTNYLIWDSPNFKNGYCESYIMVNELLPYVRREKINKILKYGKTI